MGKLLEIQKYLFLLSWITFSSCSDPKTEIFQSERRNTINVRSYVNAINLESLIGPSYFLESSHLDIIDDYLIVVDSKKSYDKGIHLFNKNDLSYLISTGKIGNGPGEITRYGRLGIDQANRSFWMPDHGKRIMWKFSIDSVLNNDNFMPTEKLTLHEKLFSIHFELINDSIGIGNAVQVLGPSAFEMKTSRLNIKSNDISTYGYEHPKLDGSKTSKVSVSISNNCYVKVYSDYDLLTICNLEGDLKYNIYGPNWTNEIQGKRYYSDVRFLNDHIVASYTGEDKVIFDEFKRPQGSLPTKLQVFDIDGGYKATLDFGTSFRSYCIDSENNLIILYFTELQDPLGYIELDDVLDFDL